MLYILHSHSSTRESIVAAVFSRLLFLFCLLCFNPNCETTAGARIATLWTNAAFTPCRNYRNYGMTTSDVLLVDVHVIGLGIKRLFGNTVNTKNESVAGKAVTWYKSELTENTEFTRVLRGRENFLYTDITKLR